jgi:hypothetical protein
VSVDFLLGPPEFYERFSEKYFGKYRSVVKDNKDPEKLGRVRVSCEGVYGSYLSPWATPCFPFAGFADGGCVWVPPVEAMVWLEFEEGNPRSPIYVGGYFAKVRTGKPSDGTPLQESSQYQDNANTLPSHAQGLPDGSDYDGAQKGNEGIPQSNFSGTYPDVRIVKTPGGSFLEFDDTFGQERVQIYHKSGTHIEVLPDGTIHEISAGGMRKKSDSLSVLVDGPDSKRVKGSSELTVDGDFTINIGGSYRVRYGGESETEKPAETTIINGDYGLTVKGSFTQRMYNSFSMDCGGDASLGAQGNLNVQAGGFGAFLYSNAQNVPLNAGAETLNIFAQNGKLTMASMDATGLLAKFGIEIQSQGLATLLPVPLVSDVGPHIFMGNLNTPPARGPAGVPLLQEPVVMGLTLTQYLNALHGFLQTWLTDYLAHAHPWYSPAYTSAAQALILPAMLTTLQTTYLTPSGTQANPLVLSDIIYVGKQ